MNLFTAPKRSKGVLRYIDEVITHTAETARKTKQTNQRSRQESKMISFQRKPLNTESSIELCLDSSITRVVVRRLRRLRRRSTREKSTRRSRAFPSLSLTRFTSLIVTEIRWYGQVCLIIGFARATGGREISFIRLAFRRRGTGPRASLTVRRVSRVARALAPVPRDARSIACVIARRWFISARPSAARVMSGTRQ